MKYITCTSNFLSFSVSREFVLECFPKRSSMAGSQSVEAGKGSQKVLRKTSLDINVFLGTFFFHIIYSLAHNPYGCHLSKFSKNILVPLLYV